jgi:hypothetical protein
MLYGDISESEVWEALERLDPLWDELFPAEAGAHRAAACRTGRCWSGWCRHPLAGRGVDESGRGPPRRRIGTQEGRVIAEPNLTGDGRTVTVRVPISIRRRGGRKLVLAPDGTIDTWAPPNRRIDNAMVKAIARAFRWREMLENGTHAMIAEIVSAEKINESYVGCVRPCV